MTDKVLLKPSDIARQYGIPEATQSKLRMTGEFAPFLKLGRSVLVWRTDLDQWLQSLARASTLEQKTTDPD